MYGAPMIDLLRIIVWWVAGFRRVGGTAARRGSLARAAGRSVWPAVAERPPFLGPTSARHRLDDDAA